MKWFFLSVRFFDLIVLSCGGSVDQGFEHLQLEMNEMKEIHDKEIIELKQKLKSVKGKNKFSREIFSFSLFE